MLDPMTASEAEAEDLLYYIRGTGSDRDRKLSAKNLAEVAILTSDCQETPTIGSDIWDGKVIADVTDDGTNYEVRKVPFNRIVEAGSFGLASSTELNALDKILVHDGVAFKTKLVDAGLFDKPQTVVILDDTYTSYTLQPGDRNLLLILYGVRAKTIVGEVPIGTLITAVGESTWGSALDGNTGWIYGTIMFDQNPSNDIQVVAYRFYACQWRKTESGLSEIGRYYTSLAADPTMHIGTIARLTAVDVKNNSLTDTFPDNSTSQTRSFKFFHELYHNLIKSVAGGLQVDHGLEITQQTNDARLPAVTEDKVGRFWYGVGNKLWWWKGKDGTTDYGKVRVDNPVETSTILSDFACANVANGEVWAYPYVGHDSSGGLLNRTIPIAAISNLYSLALTALFIYAPADGATITFTIRILHTTALGGLAETVDTDVTLTGNGSGTVLTGYALMGDSYFLSAGSSLNISSITLKTKTSGVNVAGTCSLAVATTRRAS